MYSTYLRHQSLALVPRRTLLLIMAIMLLVAMLPAPVARAATTRLVSKIGVDSGDCSVTACLTIGYAIVQSAAGDTISIGAGIYNEPVLIAKSIVLIGAGTDLATGTIINGHQPSAPDASVIGVVPGATAVISGLRLQHGEATSGGGVANLGDMTISDCIITANDSGSNGGGGIYNAPGGVLKVRNSTITGNRATQHHGGGIYNAAGGTLTVVHSTISGNSAVGHGGGIYNLGQFMLIDSTVSGNTAVFSGGGISNSGTLELTRSQILGNIVDGAVSSVVEVKGGGIDNNARLTLIDSIVSGNTARDGAAYVRGGGIASFFGITSTLSLTRSQVIDNVLSGTGQGWGGGIMASGTITLSESTVSGNSVSAAIGQGGGIFSYYDSTVSLDNSSVISNTISGVSQAEGGGIIALSGRMILRKSIVSGNRAEAPEGHGGGMNINVGSFALIDSRIENNHATTGAGGITSGGALSISGGTITGNSASRAGGMSNQGTAILSGTQVLNNVATSQVGGIYSSDVLTVTGGFIRNNQAGGRGGGLYNTGRATLNAVIVQGNRARITGGVQNDAAGKLLLIDTQIISNTATNNDGGIDNPGQMDIVGGVIQGNTAATSECGGLCNDPLGVLTVRGTHILSNTAALGGGGVDNYGTATLTNVRIAGNSALGAGGIGSSGTLTVTDSSIVDNTTSGSEAGVSNTSIGRMTLSNVTISGNRASGNAGGLMNAGQARISSAQISDNTAGSSGGGIFNTGFPTATLTLTDTTISRNRATNAGGIYSDGALTVTNSLISANELESPSGDGVWGGPAESGGGIRSGGGTLVLSGVTISGQRVRGNPGQSYGGGLDLHSVTAVLNNVVISGNEVFGNGGGIYAENARLTIAGSTISGNRATFANLPNFASCQPIPANPPDCNYNEGGGIHINSGGTISITNSTISGNHSDNIAGGIFWQGTNINTTLNHVTITNNTAVQGGGIWRSDQAATVHVRGSIIAGNQSSNVPNTSDTDCQGGLTSEGGNLFGIAGECNPTGNDLAGTEANPLDSRLDPLADNGGPTPTHALLPGSPALDAAGAACPPTDQRGVPRPQGSACDIGAYEASYWYVSSTTGIDSNDCRTPQTACATVGAAIGKANGGDTIHLAAGIYRERVSIGKDLTLQGTGKVTTIIDGKQEAGGVIYIPPSVNVQISGVTIKNGKDLNGVGGIDNVGNLTLTDSAITGNIGDNGGIVNFGTLTIHTSVISDNSAINVGGGIVNEGKLVVYDSLIRNNTASYIPTRGNQAGGGIFSGNDSPAPTMTTLVNSTITENTARAGGGIATVRRNDALTLINSTVSGNHATIGGGGIMESGPTLIHSSTIAANRADGSAGGIASNLPNSEPVLLQSSILAGNQGPSAPDCSISVISQGYNLIGDVSDCSYTPAGGDQLPLPGQPPLDPGLGPLADNGGPTFTHDLLASSPAIDAAGAACPATDQRGVLRPIGPACDVGAVEAAPVFETGFDLVADTYNFSNTVSTLDPLTFFQDFGVTATTHTITRTEVISDIQGEALDLPITFAQEDIDAVLPISITEGLTVNNPDGSQTRFIPRPTAWLYEETVVKTLYENADVGSQYRSAILGGLCAGISSTVGAFKGRVGPEFDPAQYGSVDGSIRGIDYSQVSKLLALYQGRQVDAQILNHLVTAGRYTPDGLYSYLAMQMRAPAWWADPEIIGIYQGSGCDDIEVGHALLPYRLESLPSGKGRIYVYDSNYPPVAGAPERFIALDFQAGTWSYIIGNNKNNQPVEWKGDKLFGTPVGLFHEAPQLPYLNGDSIIAVGGRMRGSWGGGFMSWGRMRGSWGDSFDPNTSTGCIVTPDGIEYVENIIRSMRLRPLSGYLSQSYIFPNVAPLTITGVGGDGQTSGDMLLFGPHGVMGFISETSPDKEYRATLDADFRTLTLHTNDSPRPMSAFQMHETADGSATRVFAVSNILVGGDGSIAIQVAPDLSSVQVINERNEPVTFQLGLSNIGSAAVTSTTRTYTIEPHAAYRYTPTNWSGLDQPITVERTRLGGRITAGLVALYDFSKGDGSKVRDSSGSAVAPTLRIANRHAVRWGSSGLEIVAPTALRADKPPVKLMKRLRETGQFTFEAWIRSQVDSKMEGTLLSIGSSSGATRVTLDQELHRATMRFIAQIRVAHDKGSSTSGLKTPWLSHNSQFVHVVLTRDADGVIRLYVNGVLRAQKRPEHSDDEDVLRHTSAGNERDNTSHMDRFAADDILTLANNPRGTNAWLGTLGLVAIYDRALDPGEVLQNYQLR